MEPYVSEAGVDRLTERINTYAETGETFDVMELLQCTTLVSVLVAGFHLINGFLQDVIGAVSFGGSFNTLLVKPGEKPHPIIHWISDLAYLGHMVSISAI